MNHTIIWNKFKNLHWRIFSKKLIASAYAKSPKSLGFNLVLQTFYEMIWETLSSKTVCEIFLIFCRSCLIKNYIIKSKFGSLKITRKLIFSRFIYFLKFYARCFEDLICKIKREAFVCQKKTFWRSCCFCNRNSRLKVLFFNKAAGPRGILWSLKL